MNLVPQFSGIIFHTYPYTGFLDLPYNVYAMYCFSQLP